MFNAIVEIGKKETHTHRQVAYFRAQPFLNGPVDIPQDRGEFVSRLRLCQMAQHQKSKNFGV